MEVEEREQLRTNNPEFAKLLDVISETYLEDGMPKITRTKLKEVWKKNAFCSLSAQLSPAQELCHGGRIWGVCVIRVGRCAHV